MPDRNPPPNERIAQEARDWIVRLSSGAAGAADLVRLNAWRARSAAHEHAFVRERAFWRDLGGLAPAPVPARAIGRRRVLAGGGALLAAAAAGAVITPRIPLWRADIRTAIGEMTVVPLPDGSTATLNTASALDLGPGLRAARLIGGEAEFRIAPQAEPFRITAGGGACETQGAVFTIRTAAERTTVCVAEGALRVAEQTLGPAQETSYTPGRAALAPVSVDPELAFAWRDQRIIFEGRPLGQALDELGRYIPEHIVLGPRGNADIPVSAVFSTQEARAAISALARTQKLAVRRIPGVAIILL